jgi:ABC-type phosphate transport system permease subunit
LGETLAVMMVAGNTIAWPSSLFAPFRTLNGNIAVEMAYSAGLHRSALFVTGGLLLVLALALVLLPALQSPVRSRS